VFNKLTYADKIQPAVERLKFEYFGHGMTVLHSADIRRTEGEFKFLTDASKRKSFLSRVDEVVIESEMDVIAHVIDKRMITGVAADAFANPANDPYYVALRMCLFSLFGLLARRGQQGRLTHIIAEARGRAEDKLLKQDFDRHIARIKRFGGRGGSSFHKFPLELLFAHKQSNAAGLQLADLTGHPIGRNYLKPEQDNHAFEIVKSKIFGRVGRSP
jgi:hypothetical protein